MRTPKCTLNYSKTRYYANKTKSMKILKEPYNKVMKPKKFLIPEVSVQMVSKSEHKPVSDLREFAELLLKILYTDYIELYKIQKG